MLHITYKDILKTSFKIPNVWFLYVKFQNIVQQMHPHARHMSN